MEKKDLKTIKKNDYIYCPQTDCQGRTTDYFYKVFAVEKDGLILSPQFAYGQKRTRGRWYSSFRSKYGKIEHKEWAIIHKDSRLVEGIERIVE